MIRPAPPPPTAAFEDDVRAMLARRAGDVAPLVPEPGAPPSEPASSSPAPDRHRRTRWPWAAAAAVVLVAGAAGAVALRPGDPDRAEVASPADGPLPPPPADAVWPLGSDVSRERVAGPVRATRAYLAELAHLPAAEVTGVDRRGEHRATVRYRGPVAPGAVTLREVDGAWFVTGATSEGIRIEGVRRVAPGTVQVDLAQGPGATLNLATARLVDKTGRVVDTVFFVSSGTMSSTLVFSVDPGAVGGSDAGVPTPLRPGGSLPCTCELRAPAGTEPAAVVVVGAGADLRPPRPVPVTAAAAAPVPEEVSPR